MRCLKGQFINPDKQTLFIPMERYIYVCICMQVSHDADNPHLLFMESGDWHCKGKLGVSRDGPACA